MSPILGIWASAQQASKIVGDFDSIATVIVGSGGAADITFTSIPSTYTHLQIRGIAKSTTASTTLYTVRLQINGDTASNYSTHYLYGDGSTTGSGALSSTLIYSGTSIGANASNVFGVQVTDILDYKDTNKYKTIRSLSGADNNGSGYLQYFSGSWRSTSAITSIKLYNDTGNLSQYSSFALYGIKGS